MRKRVLQKFSIYNIIVIAMMAALGVAVKAVIVPLVHIVTGPLFIPGGSVAGGVYMMFLVIAVMVVNKPFTALIFCAVQTLMVLITGAMGSHGVMSIVTYMLPGIGVELLRLALRGRMLKKESCFAAGVTANILGTVLVNVIFFRLPLVPLLLSLAASALSGGLGGLAAYAIGRGLIKLDPASKKAETDDVDISKQDENDAGT